MDKEFIKKVIYFRIIPIIISIVIVCSYAVYISKNTNQKVEKRVYNLNLTESYNLDTLNISDDIKWITPNKNVILKNNVVTATESGKAKLYAKKDNKIIYEIELNILTGKETLSLEEHTFVTIPGESKQISIIEKESETENINFFDKIIEVLNPNSKKKQKPIKRNKKNITIDKNNDKNNQSNKKEEVNKIEYKSEDETIAIVDEDGEIEAISPGTTEINVKDNKGNEDHAIVIVKEDELIIFNKNYTIYNGDEIIIGCSLNSNTYKMKDIKWESLNPNIVTVDNTGKVTTVNTGIATITASVGNIKEKIKIEVKENIILPTDIELTTNSVGILEGESIQVNAKIIPENATNNTLSWATNNSNIATVSNGLIIGKKEGTTLITVSTSNGIKKDININVSKKKVETETENNEITLKNIKMNVGNLSLEEGNTAQINAIFEPSNATNKDIIWTTSNPNIATINQNGTITALKEGTTTITVKSTSNENLKDSIELIVKKNSKAVSSMVINEKNVTVKVGGETRLTITVLPSTALNKNVTWKSSNTSIATIDNTGILSALKAGSVTITATSVSDPSISTTCNVTVENVEVSNIALSNTNITIKKGESQTLTATVQPSNATNKSLTWKSSNTSIATVDNTGKITGIAVGTTTITVTSNNNISKTINVEITKNITLESFMSSLDKMSKQVEIDGDWVYNNSGIKGTFEAERNDDRGVSCAKYISWALYEIGVYTTGSQGFYKCYTSCSNTNKISWKKGTKALLEQYFTFVEFQESENTTTNLMANNKIKRGDIILWYDHQHTSVYAGNGAWYDAGARNGEHGYYASNGIYHFNKFATTIVAYPKIWGVYRFK